jgi:hypothetical protein
MRSPTLRHHLDTFDRQRRVVFARLEGLSPAELWRRPGGGRWSVGQNLEHLDRMLRFFRRLCGVVVPFQRPVAWLLRRRPFARSIAEDVAGRFNRLPAAPGLRPWDRRTAPLPVGQVVRRLDAERDRFAALLAPLEEAVAGHIVLWGPLTGAFNLLQMVQALGLHEAHHFRFVQELLNARRA